MILIYQAHTRYTEKARCNHTFLKLSLKGHSFRGRKALLVFDSHEYRKLFLAQNF